ncbi:unnamed protein product [Chilo suppressalis]|uniref:Cuticle protein n=1 Tax=Chilo suppressalis TaxID=168631 RepID=A0ABN8B095_CHISP|nr:unnamed protein product [Chilo suppressalis]
MNSLVVLFSLVALAAAKPSSLIGSELISYAAPAIAAIPAAVSSQSRIDIKSSPAYVATTAIEPIARTVIAQPAVVAAPAIVAAPAAVSHQSRIDVKSSPAVVSSYLSAPIATAAIAPTIIKSAAFATPAIAAPAIATYAAPTILKSAIAPALIASPSVPLDTPEVLAARAAHFQAKALEGHIIHKRSVVAAPALTYAAAPLLSAPVLRAAPISYAAQLSIPSPIFTKAYSVHPW